MARLGPFPGMDPWLEKRWVSVHNALIATIAERLNLVLPEDLVARMEARVVVGSFETPSGPRYRPDVVVLETPNYLGDSEQAGSVAVVDEPIIIRFTEPPVTETYIEIVDAVDQSRVITSIELLSETNKVDARSRADYVSKREDYHRAGISTVEIDLIRVGEHLIALPEALIARPLLTPYRACVRRGWRLPEGEAEYYPISVRSRLPRIKVPLRPTDSDIALDLQSAFEWVYKAGRHDRTDYSLPLNPPLSPADTEWTKARIDAWRSQGNPTIA